MIFINQKMFTYDATYQNGIVQTLLPNTHLNTIQFILVSQIWKLKPEPQQLIKDTFYNLTINYISEAFQDKPQDIKTTIAKHHVALKKNDGA